jgi:hypothetical protein
MSWQIWARNSLMKKLMKWFEKQILIEVRLLFLLKNLPSTEGWVIWSKMACVFVSESKGHGLIRSMYIFIGPQGLLYGGTHRFSSPIIWGYPMVCVWSGWLWMWAWEGDVSLFTPTHPHPFGRNILYLNFTFTFSRKTCVGRAFNGTAITINRISGWPQ